MRFLLNLMILRALRQLHRVYSWLGGAVRAVPPPGRDARRLETGAVTKNPPEGSLLGGIPLRGTPGPPATATTGHRCGQTTSPDNNEGPAMLPAQQQRAIVAPEAPGPATTTAHSCGSARRGRRRHKESPRGLPPRGDSARCRTGRSSGRPAARRTPIAAPRERRRRVACCP
jgi:hypothetical protein